MNPVDPALIFKLDRSRYIAIKLIVWMLFQMPYYDDETLLCEKHFILFLSVLQRFPIISRNALMFEVRSESWRIRSKFPSEFKRVLNELTIVNHY